MSWREKVQEVQVLEEKVLVEVLEEEVFKEAVEKLCALGHLSCVHCDNIRPSDPLLQRIAVKTQQADSHVGTCPGILETLVCVSLLSHVANTRYISLLIATVGCDIQQPQYNSKSGFIFTFFAQLPSV